MAENDRPGRTERAASPQDRCSLLVGGEATHVVGTFGPGGPWAVRCTLQGNDRAEAGRMWWHQDWTMWNWLFMTLSMAVFWALVIGAVVWAVRSYGTTGASEPGGSGTAARRPTARNTLDERFARGDIGEDEYRRAREALSER